VGGGDEVLLFAVQPTDAPGRARGVHVVRRLDGPPSATSRPRRAAGRRPSPGRRHTAGAGRAAPVRLLRYRHAYSPRRSRSPSIPAPAKGSPP
jgi:hypothetical protein